MSANVTLVGRIGAEPEFKMSQAGKGVVRLRVVTNGHRMVDGKWEDVDTTWWSVIGFGNLAEGVTERLNKGSAVIVVGKVKEDTWTDKDGQERRSMVVLADSIGEDLRWAGPRVTRTSTPDADDPWAMPAEQVAAPF